MKKSFLRHTHTCILVLVCAFSGNIWCSRNETPPILGQVAVIEKQIQDLSEKMQRENNRKIQEKTIQEILNKKKQIITMLGDKLCGAIKLILTGTDNILNSNRSYETESNSDTARGKSTDGYTNIWQEYWIKNDCKDYINRICRALDFNLALEKSEEGFFTNKTDFSYQEFVQKLKQSNLQAEAEDFISKIKTKIQTIYYPDPNQTIKDLKQFFSDRDLTILLTSS